MASPPPSPCLNSKCGAECEACTRAQQRKCSARFVRLQVHTDLRSRAGAATGTIGLRTADHSSPAQFLRTWWHETVGAFCDALVTAEERKAVVGALAQAVGRTLPVGSREALGPALEDEEGGRRFFGPFAASTGYHVLKDLDEAKEQVRVLVEGYNCAQSLQSEVCASRFQMLMFRMFSCPQRAHAGGYGRTCTVAHVSASLLCASACMGMYGCVHGHGQQRHGPLGIGRYGSLVRLHTTRLDAFV